MSNDESAFDYCELVKTFKYDDVDQLECITNALYGAIFAQSDPRFGWILAAPHFDSIFCTEEGYLQNPDLTLNESLMLAHFIILSEGMQNRNAEALLAELAEKAALEVQVKQSQLSLSKTFKFLRIVYDLVDKEDVMCTSFAQSRRTNIGKSVLSLLHTKTNQKTATFSVADERFVIKNKDPADESPNVRSAYDPEVIRAIAHQSFGATSLSVSDCEFLFTAPNPMTDMLSKIPVWYSYTPKHTVKFHILASIKCFFDFCNEPF